MDMCGVCEVVERAVSGRTRPMNRANPCFLNLGTQETMVLQAVIIANRPRSIGDSFQANHKRVFHWQYTVIIRHILNDMRTRHRDVELPPMPNTILTIISLPCSACPFGPSSPPQRRPDSPFMSSAVVECGTNERCLA